MDQCADCGAWLLPEDSRPEGTAKAPCGECGSTRRIKSVASHIKAGAELSADVTLIIGWQEVDRLLDKNEYAVALLVAAVNVEFILWETLRHFSRTANPSIQDGNISSMWGQVTSDRPKGLTLSSLLKVAEYMSRHHGLVLVGAWELALRDIENVRNRIAHERGCFARLSRLEDPDWPETRIRQVLADARAFCQANG